MEDFAGTSLRDTFGNNGNRLDLGEVHQLHCRAVHTSGRCKVDHGVHIAVLQHCLLDVLVNREQSLASSPVPAITIVSFQYSFEWKARRKFSHLAHELTAEGVDDTSD